MLVVDDLSTGRADYVNPAARLERLDMRDRRLSSVARSFRPHCFVHCAAQKSVPASMSDPRHDADINIVGGLNVSRAAIDAGCATFVYITTGGALYGNPGYLPCDEDHPVRPISAYGLSKWALELYARMLLAPVMRLHVLRPANVYGPRQDPDGEAGVVAIFSKRMLRGDSVTIHGDGEQTRDWVYVADVALACEMAGPGRRAGHRQRRLRPGHKRQRAVRSDREGDRLHAPAAPGGRAARGRAAHRSGQLQGAEAHGMDRSGLVRGGLAPDHRLVPAPRRPRRCLTA